MRISSCVWRRPLAAGLVLFLAAPWAHAAAVLQQQAPDGKQPQSLSSTENGSRLPDRPDGTGQSGTPQSAPDQSQNNTKPVGTAAAPLDKGTGVAATRPAGAVIAPAKQKRARSILIRVGVIVGAAVAVGVVVGLSKTSSGRPN
jgi:hypothetical protein